MEQVLFEVRSEAMCIAVAGEEAGRLGEEEAAGVVVAEVAGEEELAGTDAQAFVVLVEAVDIAEAVVDTIAGVEVVVAVDIDSSVVRDVHTVVEEELVAGQNILVAVGVGATVQKELDHAVAQ
jgi:hypothetical protein